MLSFPHALRIYLAVEPVNMRKHFDGLPSKAPSFCERDRMFAPHAPALMKY